MGHNLDPMQKVEVFNRPNGLWFRNLEFDLVIFPLNDKSVERFELTVRHRGHTMQIQWANGHIDSYHVDQGEYDPNRNMSPLLKKVNHSLQHETFSKFMKVSSEIPENWRNFVFTELKKIL